MQLHPWGDRLALAGGLPLPLEALVAGIEPCGLRTAQAFSAGLSDVPGTMRRNPSKCRGSELADNLTADRQAHLPAFDREALCVNRSGTAGISRS